MSADIRPSLLPGTQIRKWGPFCFAAYVLTHDVVGDGERRIPMWGYIGTRRTRRGAQQLADQELATRLAEYAKPKEAA
jgi:hypothetical protein